MRLITSSDMHKALAGVLGVAERRHALMNNYFAEM